MVILSSNDLFTVRLATLVADYDQDTLTNLYQPLIGHTALALYFTLIGEANLQKVNAISSHDSLFAKMQLSIGDYLKARKALEAVGLLRTYLETNNGAKTYHYDIYSPKTPYEFFEDTLLHGLLINYVGEVDAKRLNQFYATSTSVKGDEVTSSFKEVFHPNFQSQAFIKALNSDPSIGRNRAKMKLEFRYEGFFEALKEVSQISEKAFSKTELKEISRLASLNGIDETTAAHIVANHYDPSLEKGKRVDLAKVAKAFQEEVGFSYLSSFKGKEVSKESSAPSSKTMLANKVKLLEEVTPKEFLKIMQNGTIPAIADLKIVDSISKKYHLPNPVINVIIDYTLTKNNQILSSVYADKIAVSLVRNDIKTALDAMNFLKSTSRKRKSYDEGIDIDKPIEAKPIIKPKEETSNDDPEWQELMAELEDMEDKNDGKA